MFTDWYTPRPYEEIDCRDCVCYHAMDYEDAEIIGQFCNYYGIHGNDLVKILTLGLEKWREQLDINK